MHFATMLLLCAMATTSLPGAAQPDISNPNETVIRITDRADFGESEIPGFFFYRMDAPAGLDLDGYIATKDGFVFHNHKFDSVTSVVVMEGVTMIAIPKTRTMLKIYIPTTVMTYADIVVLFRKQLHHLPR